MHLDVWSGRTDATLVDDPDLDLPGIGRALWRRKWWAIGPTLIVAVLAFTTVNLLTPRYKSEARVLIDGRENVFLRPEAEKVDRDSGVVDQEAVTSQVQLALSRDLARQVVKELKLGDRAEFDPLLRGGWWFASMLQLAGLARDPLRMTPEERVLNSYFDRLTVFPVDKSRVIAIEFQSEDPELAARAANAVGEGYVQLLRTTKQEETRAASQWLAGEIEDLRRKVADAEGRVEAFRSKSNLFIGTNNTSLSNQQLGDVNAQLAAARARKADAEAKAEFIRDLLRTGKPLDSADFLNSELIRRLAEQRAAVRAQLAEQSSTLLDGHPRIKQLKAEISDIDREMHAEAERLARALENDAGIAGARLDMLSGNLDQLKRQAASTNVQDVELRALEREAKAERDLLESYLAKYRETTARDNLTVAPAEARIISRAVVSNTPFFPRRLALVLIATLATLVVAVGCIATRELLAGNLYGPTVIEPAPERADHVVAEPEGPRLAEPAFTDIPEIGGPPAAPPAPPAVPAEPAEPAVAAIRSLADIADAMPATGVPGRRVIVAGAARHVGTTRAAVELARLLAGKGRVVLVDLALPAPGLSAYAADPDTPGVAELLCGTASFGRVITRDRSGSRVHIVPAGRVADGDGGVVSGSERLRTALDAFAHVYEYVVIDVGEGPAGLLERLANRASLAVLATTGVSEPVAIEAHQRLVDAGFANAVMYASGPSAAPAAAA